jgi:sugar/nucleoside kinase (ribokinase family)
VTSGGAPGAADRPVVVVGDVMVDVLVAVRSAVVHASDTASQIETSPGGSAANVAVWLARGGVPSALVAVVGRDPFGAAALGALRAEGVDVTAVTESDGSTGTVVALVEPEGQRSMLTDRGANLLLDARVVAGAVERLVPRHVHVSGYTVLGGPTSAAARRALASAAALGATRSADASSAGPLRDVGVGRFVEVVAGSDWFFCNREEAELLSGHRDLDEVVAGLAATFGEVVVTLGAEGAVARGPDGTALCPVPPGARVADTVGAGDALVGSYLARRLRGEARAGALEAAVATAAAAVATAGARPWAGGYSRA